MKTETALLIFDPHQDTDWIRRILKQEEGRFTHLLLGGDYFDAKSDRAGSLADISGLLHELLRDYGDNLTLLWGNHDIQYLEVIPSQRQYRNPRNQNYKIPSNYTNNRAKKLSKLLHDDLLRKGQLFAQINGYIISHAGIAKQFWPSAISIETSLLELKKIADDALLNVADRSSSLLQAGQARGGTQLIGGLTWLDFNEEFIDGLPWPQIFGHTPSFDEDIVSRARKNGRSWNLDGGQTIYGLLRESGELQIGSA